MIEPLGIELVEQPVDGAAGDGRGAAAGTIPIAADESVASAQGRAQAARAATACHLATVKLAKVGGIGAANGIAGELPVYLSSALDGPVGIAAAAHAAQALYRRRRGPGLAHGLATQLLFADTIAAARVRARRAACSTCPTAPGSGSRSTRRRSSSRIR